MMLCLCFTIIRFYHIDIIFFIEIFLVHLSFSSLLSNLFFLGGGQWLEFTLQSFIRLCLQLREPTKRDKFVHSDVHSSYELYVYVK